ncbi:hypothetical protein Fcan01_25871, partial [Folsomia candida]
MEYSEVTRALEELGLEKYVNEFKIKIINSSIDCAKCCYKQHSISQAVDDEKSNFSASLLDEKEMEDRGLRCVELFRNSSLQLTPKRKGVRKNPRILQFTPTKTDLTSTQTPPEFQDGPTINEQNSHVNISDVISQPSFVFETPPFARIPDNVQYIQVNNQNSDTGRNNIYGFNIEEILLTDENARRIINSKIPANDFILRSDRQAVAGVLIKEIMRCLGT